MFWKTVKTLLSEKGINTIISLINDNKMIIEDTEVANSLNMCLETAVNSTGIVEGTWTKCGTETKLFLNFYFCI